VETPTTSLAVVDYVIIAVYLIGTVALGLAIGWKFESGRDFFLAGRSLPWWAVGLSLVASDIGGTDIIGVGGAAFRHGISAANFEWIGCVPAMIVAAFVFIPVFYRMGIYTIPEFMEKRYNSKVRLAFAVCWLAFMACNLGIMLFASAKMLNILLGWSATYSILLTAILVGIYTFSGGLKAVVYTDTIQCAVMIGGCLLVLILGLNDLGGWGNMMTKINSLGERTAHHGDLIIPADRDSPFVWPGIFFGLALILSPAYWIGNQAIVQRSLGAKNVFQAQAAFVWGSLLKIIIPVIIVIPGLIALAKFPDLQDGDHAFPTLVARVLPAGARGVFLAAFIAALMSSIDSYLNSASTVITNDFYLRYRNPGATDRQLLNMGRGCTVVLMVWAVLFAFWILKAGEGTPIYAIFQTLLAFFQGPALAVILCGFFWKRANGVGALAGFLSGVAMAVTLWVLQQWHEAFGIQPLFKVPEAFLYFSVWAFLTSWFVIVIASLLTKPEGPEKTQFLDSKSSNATEPS